MNLENYISTLLYQHDCVTVPGFGAFIGQKLNAVYEPENSVFSPPSKKIAFNSALINNDGLLVQAVAVGRNISYEQAMQEVGDVVNFWKNHLNANAGLNLPGLGLISKNSEGKLEFMPGHPNFLPEAYGLERVKSEYILTEAIPTDKSMVWWKVAALVPILLCGYLYFSKPQPVADFVNQQWSGFISPTNTQNQTVEEANAPKLLAEEVVVEETVIPEERVSLIHDYQVIAGAFKKQSEVEPELKKLHEKGFENALFTQKRGSFYYVAFATFSTKEEALAYRLTVLEQFPETWVLSLKE
ncbi:MAG: SPOR domain-containing protein [Weeksellaceae bacterium]|jgi:hypothetical protein